jgi:hypothetical protein
VHRLLVPSLCFSHSSYRTSCAPLKVLGAALCTAVDAASVTMATAAPSTTAATPSVSVAHQVVQLPLDPLPSTEEAEGFLSQQQTWLDDVRDRRTVDGTSLTLTMF